MGHFGKYHDTLCLTPPNFAIALFLFSLGTIISPKGNWKQYLCKIWGRQTKNIMVFSEVAYLVFLMLLCCFERLLSTHWSLIFKLFKAWRLKIFKNITNIARELKAILIRERVFLIPLYAPNDHFSRLVLPAKNSAFPWSLEGSWLLQQQTKEYRFSVKEMEKRERIKGFYEPSR